MSKSQYQSKSRNEKLRVSCDACHLLKIKCSKTRPLCSRCLVCGSNCTYSPSARVGRRSKNKSSPEDTGPDHLEEDHECPFESNSTFWQDTSVVHADESVSTAFNPEQEYPPTFQSNSVCYNPEQVYINPLLLTQTQDVSVSTWLQSSESLFWDYSTAAPKIPDSITEGSFNQFATFDTSPTTSDLNTWYATDQGQQAFGSPPTNYTPLYTSSRSSSLVSPKPCSCLTACTHQFSNAM